MDWEKALKHYENRLEQALDVTRHALHLAKIPQIEISAQDINALKEVEDPAGTQLARIKRREFRIAVVGLEKAGKSTFVNAWLETDLLPNDNPRCTFSTTQIYSVTDDCEQCLEVKAKTPQSFGNMQKELEEKAVGQDDIARNAQKDLETIRRHEETLEEVISTGNRRFEFVQLEGITDNLKKYVADERYAHAVEEVQLYTSRLAAADGIVFFDVPGIDSGLGKHLEDSEDMLKDCDAVICIQRSQHPSLRAGEQRLIELVRTGDREIELEDKLFVFFGQIDAEGSSESYIRDLDEAGKEWKKYGFNKPERVIPGSAAAYLLYKHVAGENLIQNVGRREEILERLKNITGSSDDNVENSTGIPVIKKAIDRYLKEERTSVFQKRCERLLEKLIEPSRRIYKSVAEKYPEDIEAAKRSEKERRIDLLMDWWTKDKWNEIQTKVGEYYESLCNGTTDGRSNSPEAVEKFRKRYNETIRTEMKSIPIMLKEKRENLFRTKIIEGLDWTELNYIWRERLHSNVIEAVEKVARALSGEILQEYDELIQHMTALLWDVDAVRISQKIIVSRDEFENRLVHGLRTLFLRFSRPVARVLIAAPQNSQRRKERIEELGPDMDLLDPYYEGEERAYECLTKFAKYGIRLLLDHYLRQNILGIDLPPELSLEELDKLSKAFTNQHPTKEDMIQEVEADLNAFEEYLTNAVFSAAGFLAYREQEIFSLCQRFRDKEYSWREILRGEFFAGNQTLLSEVPEKCKGDIAYDIEVCERLKELRISLSRFDGIEF